MRLDKFLTDCSALSRKQAKDCIKKGQVTLDGQVEKRPEIKVTENAEIYLRGIKLHYEKYEYFMLNKPSGVVSATEDKCDRTVVELISESTHRIFPVGRLDKDTEGLLLLTDDGELAHRLLSPRYHVEKEYYVETDKENDEEDVIAFRAGMDIGEKNPLMPAELTLLDKNKAHIVIQEGKYHQIKRMFEKRGKKVTYLKRIRMGKICLDEKLALGEYRRLTGEEMEWLRKNIMQ